MAVYALRKGIVCATEREKLITKFQQLEVSVCLVMLMGFFYTREVPVADKFFIRENSEKCRLLMSFLCERSSGC